MLAPAAHLSLWGRCYLTREHRADSRGVYRQAGESVVSRQRGGQAGQAVCMLHGASWLRCFAAAQRGPDRAATSLPAKLSKERVWRILLPHRTCLCVARRGSFTAWKPSQFASSSRGFRVLFQVRPSVERLLLVTALEGQLRVLKLFLGGWPAHSLSWPGRHVRARRVSAAATPQSLGLMNGYGENLRGQIIEVWAHNLEEELERIRDVVERYPYIALDTEFPGIVARPTSNALDYNYRTVKYNVDLLKVIQLGLTFADSRGRLAEGTCTWQFNFRFDLNEDMYAQNSIDFLKQSGIDFDKQQKKGVEVHDFGELIMNSGLVMNEDVKWISFHGCYDFGYLLKLLTCEALPESENAFFELVQDFFPSLYDIKFLLRDLPTFNLSQGSSLQKVSEQLNVQRVGPQHQAGSDSLVTCRTFFNLVESYFDGKIDEAKFSGVIYGLGATAHKPHRGPPGGGGGGLTSPPAQDLAGAGGLLHSNDGKQQQDLSSSGGELMLGGPGAMSRYVSAGPGNRLGGGAQHHHHSQQPQQQQQGSWSSVGRMGGGIVSIRQQQQHPQQALLEIPGNGGAAATAAAAADSSNPLVAGTPDRLRGSPGGAPAAHHSGSGGLLPGGGGPHSGASRGFGAELHRTGSAPPAPLLCGSGEGRVWPAPGGGLTVGSTRPANVGQQQHQAEAAAAQGPFVFEGAAGGPAGAPRRP
ncbi:hypothetical protein Efla_003729 [Eimeria flavescens]